MKRHQPESPRRDDGSNAVRKAGRAFELVSNVETWSRDMHAGRVAESLRSSFSSIGVLYGPKLNVDSVVARITDLLHNIRGGTARSKQVASNKSLSRQDSALKKLCLQLLSYSR